MNINPCYCLWNDNKRRRTERRWQRCTVINKKIKCLPKSAKGSLFRFGVLTFLGIPAALCHPNPPNKLFSTVAGLTGSCLNIESSAMRFGVLTFLWIEEARDVGCRKSPCYTHTYIHLFTHVIYSRLSQKASSKWCY